MIKQIITITLFSIALAACGGQPAEPAPPAAVSAATAAPAEQPAATVEDVSPSTAATPSPVAPTATPAPAEPTVTPTPEPAPPTEPPAETESAIIEPIDVTYFTPPQTEGPYYPVQKPADRDSDLTVLAGAADSPAGQIVEFGGTIYDAAGLPAPGLTVEIWQTDSNGIYDHPGDRSTAQRDPNFQFYGEAVTAADGSYQFRTILPGQYEPRPRHIHAKIKDGQQELLTTQIYFTGDPTLEADGIFLRGGSENVHLVLALSSGQDVNGNPILVGEHNIILNATLSN
ncbi:MAG: hypothetical protein Kow0031_31630 [Anaerolineae bacterium]